MAAGSFAKLTATPYALQITYTGGGQADSLAATTLLAMCVAGPLKNFLTNTNTSGGWGTVSFLQTIRVYGTQQTGAAANITSVTFVPGNPNTFQAASAGVCTALIEIAFKNSMER